MTTPPRLNAADAAAPSEALGKPLLRPMLARDVVARRGSPIDAPTLASADALLREIEASPDRDAAALALAKRFGDAPEHATPTSLALGPAQLRAALARLSSDQRGVLERACERIEAFARAQRACLANLSLPIEGGSAGHECLPVASAGCYAPGGRFPLPSSVLMTAIPARVAGVASVWVASPRPSDATLAAAALAGADGVLAIGGVQAIASLADGLLGAPACDVIVGPGNRWVTAAKALVSHRVGIDMLAGPSELVVLADDSADAALVASDLLAQAEHDDDAIPMLVTTSAALAQSVERELARQLATLPTRDTALAALRNGACALADRLDDAIAACNRIGAEHLEVHTRDAARVASRITNAGAVFVGGLAAEVLGDYGAAPNHVLPTGGSSRFRAGLSVFTFLRARTWLRVDDPTAATPIIADAAALGRIEGLEAHARSAERRHPR
jgi:phosphoribosyl-ATP pyrophosphohydrolase/phosphoribosyl-AMP cyclohydrolase/histidinol dehydrogenase